MRLRDITIEGFRSFRNERTFDLAVSLAAICGPNHSGKTSILKAIEYALFGPGHGEAPHLVNRGSDGMSVTLRFEQGDTYTITRSHNGEGRGHKLTVLRGDSVVSSRDLSTTQELINSIVGMNREVSRVTWMSMQGDVELLASMDGATRRSIFAQVFGLEAYGQWHATAKKARADVVRQCDTLRGTLQGLAPIDLNADLVHADLDAELKAVNAYAEAERQRAAIESSLQSIASLTQQLNSLDTSTPDDSLDDAQRELANAREDASEATDALGRANAELSTAENNVRTLQRELDQARSMTVGHCQSCGQHLTAEAREFLEKSITDKLNQAIAERSELEQRAREAEATASAFRTTVAQLNTFATKLAERYRQAERNQEMSNNLRERIEQMKPATKEAAERLAPPRFSAEELYAEKAARELESKRAQQREATEKELAKAEHNLELLDVLVSAWAPSGIPMAIMRSVTHEVSHDATSVLAEMGSDLVVSLDADGASIGITVSDAAWDSLSGQERFYTALALRVALGRAIARRTGTSVGTMLIDEGWGSLDAGHSQAAVNALTELSKSTSILTVTHIDEVASQMPERIQL